MKSDIEIAMEADLLPIQQVAEKLNITRTSWIFMGNISKN